jgi:hypothetical protein
MDLHPYDDVNRQFHHHDRDRAMGLAIITKRLGLPTISLMSDALYDLSFYSGGMGIIDNLAITIPADREKWTIIVQALNAKSPEDAVIDPKWADDFLWLVTDDEAPLSPRESAVNFINEHRSEFQLVCCSTDHIFFQYDSSVNSWVALWGSNEQVNYLGYDQQ